MSYFTKNCTYAAQPIKNNAENNEKTQIKITVSLLHRDSSENFKEGDSTRLGLIVFLVDSIFENELIKAVITKNAITGNQPNRNTAAANSNIKYPNYIYRLSI